MRLYHTAGPNDALIISGGTKHTITAADGSQRQVGYRVKVGGGTLVVPWLESVSVMPLDIFSVDFKVERVYTANNVVISVGGQAQVKVRSDDASLHLAAEHFLGKGGEQIQRVASDVIEGYMRAVLGTRTIESIISTQEEMVGEILAGAARDLDGMGLALLSFSFKEITDEDGFISALAEPRIAQVKRDAAIARAEAERDALVKTALLRQEGDVTKLGVEEQVMEATSNFEKKRAAQQALVNEERAKADVSYDLERLRLSRDLKAREAEVILVEKNKAIEIQQQEVLRRERELEASIKRPAEAHQYQARLEAELDAYRKELEGKGKAAWILAQGEAEAASLRAKGAAEASAIAAKAESYRSYSQAAFAEMMIKVLPEVARAVSEPLSRIDKIVMVGGGDSNGISKLTGQIAQVVAQVPSVVEALTGINVARFVDGLTASGSASRQITAGSDSGDGPAA